ncbi:zinc ABC transporter [Cutibacterium acnes JCM 18920]|nr:zinc ABC transporter [Cutibacterium acnes JCM 18920]
MDFSTIINFDSFSQLVPLVRGSIIAGIILGVLAGLIGPMIHARDLPSLFTARRSFPSQVLRWPCSSEHR